MDKMPNVDRTRISRELGLFQQDIRKLPARSIRIVKAYAFLTMQLKRFTRDELALLIEFCDGAIREKDSDLSNVVIEGDPKHHQEAVIEISEELLKSYTEKPKPDWKKI